MTDATSAQEPRSSVASPLVRLSRMLRSMSRRYPRAHKWNTRGAFGAWLDETRSVRVSYSGSWTDADLRDCLALFATWLVADPAALMGAGEPLVGASSTETPHAAR